MTHESSKEIAHTIFEGVEGVGTRALQEPCVLK